jgi:hypothetical protein
VLAPLRRKRIQREQWRFGLRHQMGEGFVCKQQHSGAVRQRVGQLARTPPGIEWAGNGSQPPARQQRLDQAVVVGPEQRDPIA